MTREEKAKAYDGALERAKRLTSDMTTLQKIREFIFPELAESEDERIRKELKEAFEAYDIESTWNGIPIRSIFSWLEKLAKSERVIKAARRVLNNWLDDTGYSDVFGGYTELEYAIREYDGDERQKEQKPVPFSCGRENGAKWSEEDENALEYIHDLISWGYSKKFMDAQTAHDMRKWVNEHLGPDTFQNGNSHWKPSEEQMDRLSSIVAALRKDYCDDMADFLASIYHNLKKLM